jgi:putative DNA methylase
VFSRTIEARPHTPVYKMHKYFARRPWNVFSELIAHYSSVGDLILDPFMGGGVTVIESLRLKRKAIGIDLNPLATFITRMEAKPLSIEQFRISRAVLSKKVRDELLSFYATTCPKCARGAQADWLEWDNRRRKIERIKFDCAQCGSTGTKKCSQDDTALAERIDREFDSIVTKRKLWFPQTQVPLGDKTSSLLVNGITHFDQLFTRRNLLALAILFSEVKQASPVERDFLIFTFSSCLKWCSRQSHLRGKIVEGWAMHAYWIYPLSLELNVWRTFERRFEAVIRGKEYSNKEIGSFYRPAYEFNDLTGGASCLVLNASSSQLPLPANSIDAIITDPPYGGNVNYGELSDFWWIWLNNGNTIEKGYEAVINKTQGKSLLEYEMILASVFRECFRVLKPGKHLVSTFNSKDARIVSSFIAAASRAGFEIKPDGISYQKPIKAYTTTFHAMQVGAFVGDFIFEFTKPESPRGTQVDTYIEDLESFKQELAQVISKGLRNKMTDAELRETAYKHLIPYIATHTSVPHECIQATEFLESRMTECSTYFSSRRTSIIETRRRTFRKGR